MGLTEPYRERWLAEGGLEPSPALTSYARLLLVAATQQGKTDWWANRTRALEGFLTFVPEARQQGYRQRHAQRDILGRPLEPRRAVADALAWGMYVRLRSLGAPWPSLWACWVAAARAIVLEGYTPDDRLKVVLGDLGVDAGVLQVGVTEEGGGNQQVAANPVKAGSGGVAQAVAASEFLFKP